MVKNSFHSKNRVFDSKAKILRQYKKLCVHRVLCGENFFKCVRRITKVKMENEEKQPEKKVGEIHKRRETMPDGKRYIIYYTFGNEQTESREEVKENV